MLDRWSNFFAMTGSAGAVADAFYAARRGWRENLRVAVAALRLARAA